MTLNWFADGNYWKTPEGSDAQSGIERAATAKTAYATTMSINAPARSGPKNEGYKP